MIPQRSPSPPPTQPRQPIPAGHFLALPPSYCQPADSFSSGAPLTSAHKSNGLAPNVASLASADFEVDVRTGFLPATKNIERLPPAWTLWEEALDAARGDGIEGRSLMLGGGRDRERLWREAIEAMSVLDTAGLRVSLTYMRRAHVVLAFLAHFYAHTSLSTSTPRTTPLPIPSSISVPLLKICPSLGLPPVVTYADTVLYNFLPLNPALELGLPYNPPSRAIESFTNTRSEEQFYVISALCEIAGAEALRLMRQSLDELFLADSIALKRLTVYLRKLGKQIDRIGDITLSMITEVDPEEFYHLIRPWFRGGDDGPQSKGWAYLGLDDNSSSEAENQSNSSSENGSKGRLYSGPSAGQSSLIHAIDIFLTVNHSADDVSDSDPHTAAAHPNTASPSSSSSASFFTSTSGSPSAENRILLDSTPITSTGPQPTPKPNEATFVERMLQYMPVQHRSFLLHLNSHPTPLRSLILARAQTHPRLVAAYDEALAALQRFREKHMRVVSVFIVQQSRRRPSERIRKIIGQTTADDGRTAEGRVDIAELRGTGGSPLFKFLKRCRDNTTRAMVSKPAGPAYELA